MIFVYGAPTCGKTFAITELSGGSEWHHPDFPSLDEIVERARKFGFFYKGHLLLDTDWLFPTVIKRFVDVKNAKEAWDYWRSNHDPVVQRIVEEEFLKLNIDKCIIFTNLWMWTHGVDVPLRYARSVEDLRVSLKARDALKARDRGTPVWVSKYAPPPGSIRLPMGRHIYPRIIEDLATLSPIFSTSGVAQRLQGNSNVRPMVIEDLRRSREDEETEYFRLDDPHQLSGSYVSDKLGKCLSQACVDSLASAVPPSTKAVLDITRYKTSTSRDVRSLTLDFTDTIRAAVRDKNSSLLFEMSKVNLSGRNVGKNSVYQLIAKIIDGGGYTSLTLARVYLTIPTKYEARSLRLAECSGWVPYSSPKRERRFKSGSYPFLTAKNEKSVVRVLNVNPKLGSSVQIHGFFQTKGSQSKFLDAQDASEGCFLCSYTLDLDASDGQCRPTPDELVMRGSDWGITAQATLVAIVEASAKLNLPNHTRVKQTVNT